MRSLTLSCHSPACRMRHHQLSESRRPTRSTSRDRPPLRLVQVTPATFPFRLVACLLAPFLIRTPFKCRAAAGPVFLGDPIDASTKTPLPVCWFIALPHSFGGDFCFRGADRSDRCNRQHKQHNEYQRKQERFRIFSSGDSVSCLARLSVSALVFTSHDCLHGLLICRRCLRSRRHPCQSFGCYRDRPSSSKSI